MEDCYDEDVERILDKKTIEAFLRRDTHLHAYGIGDLDERFWPDTEWYGSSDGSGLRSLVLLYKGLSTPCVLALGREEVPELKGLIRELLPSLPEAFYCHLSPGIAEVLRGAFDVELCGRDLKMALMDARMPAAVSGPKAAPLGVEHGEELQRFYDESYPDHWFERRVLSTGKYFGIRERGALVCAAGVHVYSSEYRVAALGNIATRPDRRGRGLAAAVTAGLCRDLLRSVDHISLNVRAENAAAIACYRKLGFAPHAEFEEQHARRLS